MADTREFSSSMSTPQSGSANLDIIVDGVTTNYNPFGPDRSITIPSAGAENVFIDAPANLDSSSVTQYDEGTAGQEKYTRCMELLGDGYLPVCTGRQGGPAGTHGMFGTLYYISDSCELCFYFPRYGLSDAIWKLASSGIWYKVT